MQYPNLAFKYQEVEVYNENIIYPIHVRIQEISFGAGVQAQLTGYFKETRNFYGPREGPTFPGDLNFSRG